jgi:hypothetical protein
MSYPYPDDLALLNQEEAPAPSPLDMVAPEENFNLTAEEAVPEPEVTEPAPDVRAEDKIEDEDLKADISAICVDLDNADRSLRDWRNRLYKKLAMYWDGDQILYYDDQLQAWAPVSQGGYLIHNNEDIDLEEYAKVVNIYKAFGQSIIAALTVQPPRVKYIPSDADISKDIDTAKVYELIQKKKIEKFNDPEELITKFCKIRYNQGLVFAYIYAKENGKLGHYKEPVKDTRTKQTPVEKCSACGQEVQSAPNPETEQLEATCASCGYTGPAIGDVKVEQEEYIKDYNLIPKHEICIDLYGPLNVDIPLFVTSLEQVPALTLTTEMHYAEVMFQFGLTEKPGTGENPTDQRWVRLPNRYFNDAEDLVTVKQRWLRPWAFNILGDKDKKAKYEALYPDGCYCVFLDDILVIAENESLDEHWIVGKDPLEDHLQGIPIGKDAVDIQDMTNEMFNLTLDAIEHNIPETFVRPETLDLDMYKSQRAKPGNVTQAKPRSGMALNSDFFETSQSSLSQEHTQFANKLFETGQFVTGAMPTIYGGALKGGSNTAKEYESSRSMSLQRLGPHWSVIKRFYASAMRIAVPMFAELMKEDEKVVEESGGSYINVVIEKAKLDGSVGDITFDIKESIPTSWTEQRDVIMSLLPTAAPGSILGSIFAEPENAELISMHLGITGIELPGEADRLKQMSEIQDMIKATPQPNPKAQEFEQALQTDLTLRDALMRGEVQAPAPRTSSIQPDPMLDNHQVEASSCRSWLISATGRWYKNNPDPALQEAWQNVYLHFTEHNAIFQQQQMQQQMQQQQQEQEGNKAKETDKANAKEQAKPPKPPTEGAPQ